MTKKKSNAGRKEKIEGIKLRILREAFADGANDAEACMITGISTTCLYEYCNRHPEFAEFKENVKGMLRFRAKRNLRKALDGVKMKPEELSTAKYILEKTDKDYKATQEGGSPNSGTQILIDNREMNPRLKSDEQLLQLISDAKNKNP